MKADKLVQRKRGKKGEGRKVQYHTINLPVELVNILKGIRAIYSEEFTQKKGEKVNVSYEQMFYRWIDNIKRFDPEIIDKYTKRGNAIVNPTLAEQEEDADTKSRVIVAKKPELWERTYKLCHSDGRCFSVAIGKFGEFEITVKKIKVFARELLERDGWSLIDSEGDIIKRATLIKVESMLTDHLGITPRKSDNVKLTDWYIHPDGYFYDVRPGKYGKSDYTKRGDRLVSEGDMLNDGFIRVKARMEY